MNASHADRVRAYNDEELGVATRAYWRNSGVSALDRFMRDALDAAAPLIAARVWDEAYDLGVADAWQSNDFDCGQTPAARNNPYRAAVRATGPTEDGAS